MKAIKYLIVVVCAFGVGYFVALGALTAYEALVKPLPVEQERVQPILNVDLCREVESGAVRARTINSCPLSAVVHQ